MRHRKLIRFTARCFIWLLGLAVIWWLTPVGPRDGWQPPEDEFVCGFLKDGRTIVTVPRSATGARTLGTPETGPIHLWNLETGALRATHFSRQDIFVRVGTAIPHNWLIIEERIGAPTEHNFRLQIRDALSATTIADFRCHVPQDNVWWMLSPDGRTTAFVTYENGEAQVDWKEVSSGQTVHTLSGWGEPILFSPDSRRLAACRWDNDRDGRCINRIGVWDIAGSEKPAVTFEMPAAPGHFSPARFSPDVELLVDDHCQVWEVASGRLRFKVPGVGRRFTFTPDGCYLVTVGENPSESWLAYYEVTTGAELVERRVPLDIAAGRQMSLVPATRNGDLLLAYRIGHFSDPNVFQQWIGKIPGLERVGAPKPNPAFALIESVTGREVTRGEFGAQGCTPGDRYLLSRTRDNVYKLWDIPPRKPLRWLLPAAAVWSVVFALVAAWRVRRARGSARVATAVTPPVSETSSSLEHENPRVVP